MVLSFIRRSLNVQLVDKMKVLNLYAGIGGNRKLWNGVDVTAVEIEPKIANIYQDFFPKDTVIIGDAHQYLLEHFNDYDFIWSSPPCPTHSITRFMQDKKVYPDMGLYQEIIVLQQWCKNKWVVENVVPYYNYLIQPTAIVHRHSFWSNFNIISKEYPKIQTCKMLKEREFLQNEFGFNIDNYDLSNKRQVLRNCVVPELGRHIFNCAFKTIQKRVVEG